MRRRGSGAPSWQAGRPTTRRSAGARLKGRLGDALTSMRWRLRPSRVRTMSPALAAERLGQAASTRRGRLVFAAVCLELAALLIR